MSRAPKHRASSLRGFWGEVSYLLGRIGLILLLVMVAILFIVAALVGVGYAFVYFIERYTEGPS